MIFDESATELVREALILSMKIAAPILIAGVVIGLLISLFQAVTSIQDQTLTFVPKIVAMVAVAVLTLPWIIYRLMEFTHEMLSLF